MNHALAPDEVIVGSTVGLPAELGGSPGAERVAYTVLRAALVANAHVAEVSAVPNPRLVAHTGARAVAFRQDGAALLYSRFALAIPSGQQLFEATIDSGQAHELIGAGASGLYDGTGEVVFVQQVAGGAPILAAATRGAFGSPQRLGTPGRAAWFAGLSGAPRAVALIGEGPESGPRPSSARIALVNAWAPERLLYLADFPTPLSLPVEVARIVTY